MLELLKKIDNNRSFVDSFTILIPEAYFLTKNNDIDVPIFTIREDEILDEKKGYYKIVHKGITLRISRKYIPKKGYFLELVATTKMLEGDYFQGFSGNWKKTVEKWLFFVGFNLAKGWEKEVIIYDIDITIDFHETKTSINRLITILVALSKSTLTKKYFKTDKKIGKYANGILINTRNVAVTKAPFLKIYDKEDELKTKSKEFVESFNIKIPKDTYRLEITVKNRKHVKFLSNRIKEMNGVNEIFESENVRKKIIKIIVKQLFSDIESLKIEVKKEIKDLSPQDIIIFSLIRSLYDVTLTKQKNKLMILTYINETARLNDRAFFRMSKKIDKIFRIFINSIK